MRLTVTTDPGAVDVSAVDLTDPGLFAEGEPHAVWQAMRERAPVRWQPMVDGPGFWSVTRYADVEAVLRDHATFSSERGTMLNVLGRPEPASRQQFATTDPPRHGAMRAPVQRKMTARMLERHAAAFRAGIERLLDELPAGAPFDFAALTDELPRLMIGPLMGIPDPDWPELRQLVGMVKAEAEPAYMLPEGPHATLDKAHRELFAYLFDLVIRHRRQPREDLVDILLSMELEGARLGGGTLVANCYSLLIGAGAAIADVPNAALLELVRTGRYAEWADHPEWLGTGVEEAVRWASPASHLMRHATRPARIGDVEVGEGEHVVVWLGSANRDEAVFADPYRFDPRREPNRHLGFGAGHHFCIGSAVARITLREFFGAVFARYAGFELAGEVRHVRSNWLAGIKTLLVVGRERVL